MPRRSPYFDTIRKTLDHNGLLGADPRHVEAYMRLEHPTLDGLSREQFDAEVAIAVQCVHKGGTPEAEALALSYGL